MGLRVGVNVGVLVGIVLGCFVGCSERNQNSQDKKLIHVKHLFQKKTCKKCVMMQTLVPKIVNSTTILQISSLKTTRLRKFNVCINTEMH